jgi:aminoglycoside phosphotransferase family enzyme
MSKRDMNATWSEMQAWARLVAQFHERTGRDPDERETRIMLDTARLISANTAEVH